MVYILFDARRAMRETSPLHAATAVGLSAGLIAWLTHNMVAPLYQSSLVNRVTFIFVVALLAVIPRLRGEEESAPL
jgi:hypothetical protein